MTTAFDVAVSRREQMLVAAPVGELDLYTAPRLTGVLRDQESFSRLVLDLRGLGFMDSTGLRLLVAETERAAAEGYELSIVPGGQEVSRLLRLTRMDERLPLADPERLGV